LMPSAAAVFASEPARASAATNFRSSQFMLCIFAQASCVGVHSHPPLAALLLRRLPTEELPMRAFASSTILFALVACEAVDPQGGAPLDPAATYELTLPARHASSHEVQVFAEL